VRQSCYDYLNKPTPVKNIDLTVDYTLKPYSRINKQTWKKLSSLCFSDGQLLYYTVPTVIPQEEKDRIHVCIAYKKSSIIGWGILDMNKGERVVMVYVKPKYRRGGIGKLLVKILASLRKSGKIYFRGWNKRAYKFFQSCKIPYLQDSYKGACKNDF